MVPADFIEEEVWQDCRAFILNPGEMLTEAQRQAIDRGLGQPSYADINGFAALLRGLGLFRMEVTSALYDGGIRFTDAFLGGVLEDLRRLGLEDRTLVVFTSDHGEEFGDHDRRRFYDAHCQTVYEELTRVPLIMRLPGRIPAGRVVDTPVELVDVAPTILYAMGLAQARDMDGTALTVAFDDALAARHPPALVASYETAPAGRAGAAGGTEVDEQEMEDLRALGYVQATDKPATNDR